MDKIKEYLWVMFGIAGLLLIAAALVFGISKDAQDTLIMIIGAIIGIGIVGFAVFRIRTLGLYKKSNLMLGLHIGEIALHILIGLLYIFKIDIMGTYPWFTLSLASIFYLRGFLFFYGVVYKDILADQLSFFAHLIFLTFGSIFIFITIPFSGHDKYEVADLKPLIIVLFIITALFFGLKSYKGYVVYKHGKANRLKLNEYSERKSKTQDKNEIDIDDLDKIIEEPSNNVVIIEDEVREEDYPTNVV